MQELPAPTVADACSKVSRFLSLTKTFRIEDRFPHSPKFVRDSFEEKLDLVVSRCSKPTPDIHDCKAALEFLESLVKSYEEGFFLANAADSYLDIYLPLLETTMLSCLGAIAGSDGDGRMAA